MLVRGQGWPMGARVWSGSRLIDPNASNWRHRRQLTSAAPRGSAGWVPRYARIWYETVFALPAQHVLGEPWERPRLL